MDQRMALIVDDNKKNLQILANLLGQQSVDHISLSNPADVESTLETLSRLDVIFLDLEMPGMSGYDVLKVVQDDARFSSVPVVAYTVHVSEISETYERGFHSFLAKPIDPDLFPEQLARIFSGERIWVRG